MEEKTNKTNKNNHSQEEAVNPLRAEKIRVQFVPRLGGPQGDNPRHVLSGGMADNVEHKYCLPIIDSTGNYKNALTNSEKSFLEDALDLDHNALSVYGHYWDDYYVTIGKDGIVLDLMNPADYIKYKVLLANNNLIAPNIETMQDRPKTTYEFVLVRENEESEMENLKMTDTMASYKEFGKIENDIDTMRILVELMDLKPYSANTPSAMLRSRINQLIQADAKTFLRTITDPMLHTKVIIRRAQEIGKLSKRGDFYYFRSDNSPLCDPGEDPTLSVAARWLNQPSNSDIKALIESEVEKARTEK